MFCNEQSIEATGPFGGAATAVKCRSWLCPNCFETRKRQLQAICIAGQPNRFITITARRGQFATEIEAAQAIVKAWRTAVQRWRRMKGTNKCEYLCVFEPHISGWPHLHVLWRGAWLDQKWLSDTMRALLNSPVVHVSLIRDVKSSVFYVAKYFSKAPTKFGTLKRYWKSGNYASSKLTDAQRAFPKHLPLERRNIPLSSIKEDWTRWHRTVTEIGSDIIAWGTWWVPPIRTEPIIRTQWRNHPDGWRPK